MSDLFHEEIPTLFVGRVLNVIAPRRRTTSSC
jgi:protein gp37